MNNKLGGQNIISHKEPSLVKINGVETVSGHSDVLRVYSKNLVLGLINNGVEPNKTKKTICPKIDNEFFFDFLRGYIDGDGCYFV